MLARPDLVPGTEKPVTCRLERTRLTLRQAFRHRFAIRALLLRARVSTRGEHFAKRLNPGLFSPVDKIHRRHTRKYVCCFFHPRLLT